MGRPPGGGDKGHGWMAGLALGLTERNLCLWAIPGHPEVWMGRSTEMVSPGGSMVTNSANTNINVTSDIYGDNVKAW